ncbi:MAG: radical SAM protein [Nitrospinae bacterium]|nr:radical SAM protein [Nitrospinota bacterium]
MISQQAKFLSRIIKGNLLNQKIPVVVSLTLTNRCNYDCIYCYGDYFNRKDKDVPKEKWLGLIKELSHSGTTMIHLGGGEPLLLKDIGDYINAVKDGGMICRMNSNGALVPERIEQLKRLDSLCISLDGKEETNDKNRGKGTFKEITEGIACAKNNGIPVHVSATITMNNIGALEEIIELSKTIGFNVEFGLPYESTSKTETTETTINDEIMKDFIRKVLDYKKMGYPIFYSDKTYQYALNWPVSYKEKLLKELPSGFEHIECYMGRFMCFVDANGLVYPCGQLIDTFPALNFAEVGFQKAWDNLEEHKPCKTCYCPCFTEFNSVFGLKAETLWSNIKRELKGFK